MLDKNNLYGNVPYCARMDGTTSDGETLHQRKTPDWSNIMTFSVGDNDKYFADISPDKYCKILHFIAQTFWDSEIQRFFTSLIKHSEILRFKDSSLHWSNILRFWDSKILHFIDQTFWLAIVYQNKKMPLLCKLH